MCRGFDPLFSLWQDRARSFWGTFSHPPTAKLSFGVQKLPIFSGQRHTPISFQAEYPPFSHPPTTKLSFGVQKLPIFTKIDLFGPKFLDLGSTPLLQEVCGLRLKTRQCSALKQSGQLLQGRHDLSENQWKHWKHT